MTLEFVLRTLLLGLFVGAIARFLLPGKNKMGWLATSLFGIGGSFAGGYLTQVLIHHDTNLNGLRPTNFLGSIVGAMVLLAIWRVVGPSSDRK